MRTPLISTQTSQLNKALCTSARSTPTSHFHPCLPHCSSVRHPQDADKATSSSSTLSFSQMLFATCHSKPKQAMRAPWLIKLHPMGSRRLYSWQTVRYWLWLGKLGPAGGVIQQLYLFQDNSGAPHYFWCTIDFAAIKSWRFQTWLKCQISITKKKISDIHKMDASLRCCSNASPLPHFLITSSNKLQTGIFLWWCQNDGQNGWKSLIPQLYQLNLYTLAKER